MLVQNKYPVMPTLTNQNTTLNQTLNHPLAVKATASGRQNSSANLKSRPMSTMATTKNTSIPRAISV